MPETTEPTANINTNETKRVLIIDDQRLLLDVLREILASFQHGRAHEVTTAQSVPDALGILERDHFDLVLLDMVMPGIGNPVLRRPGLDVLQRIRQLGINAPVLMMSGDYERRKEADALTQGAFAYLHKPFDLCELDRLVARAIAAVKRRT